MSGGHWKEMYNAACEGDLALVRWHVEAGVDVNYPHPEFLSTPLVASLLADQEAVALFLLDHGADPHQFSESDGLVPLAAARRAGLRRAEARLVALGATAPADKPPVRQGWLRLLFGRWTIEV